MIGYQLSGENATVENLITGTRYMNIEGMLPFENKVADYVQATNNHVLYRATPVFEGNNLLASGVLCQRTFIDFAILATYDSLRSIQMYEQRNKNINKANADVL